MTKQLNEILFYNGHKYILYSEPLRKYLKKSKTKPNFRFLGSNCWRGYLATWSIDDNKLFLVAIDAEHPDGTKVKLSDIFLLDEKKVFAVWFTGELILPLGNILHFSPTMCFNYYERYMILTIKQGILISSREEENKEAFCCHES